MELFTCTRHKGDLTLTAQGCAQMWRRAQQQKLEPGLMPSPCRGCAIGAAHAGEKLPELRLPSEVDRICSRCHRPSPRFIYGRLCVSCFNREREWIKGKNAKGTRPTRMKPLAPVSIACLVESSVSEITVPLATGILEAALSCLRKEQRPVLFARPVPRAVGCQMSMFGGI